MELSFLSCPYCECELNQNGSELDCHNCHQDFRIAGDYLDFTAAENGKLKGQQKFWNVRAHFYEALLPVTTMLGNGSFSYQSTIGMISERLMVDLPQKAPILDVATGTGLVIRNLAAAKRQNLIIGVDYSENMLKIAKKRVGSHAQIVLIKADAHALPFKDGTFAGATCAAALGNMRSPRQVLKEIVRVTADGGKILLLLTLAEENANWRINLSKKALDVSYTALRVPLQWFNREEIEAMFVDLGCRGVKTDFLSGCWALIEARK